MKTKLLVPTDFTNEAHSAIQHAVKLGVIVQAEVILLNVVKDKSDIPAATSKLKEEENWAKKSMIKLKFAPLLELEIYLMILVMQLLSWAFL